MPDKKENYRSLNKIPTVLGIDRRLAILAGMFAAMYFQITKQFLVSVGIFASVWGMAFWITKWEPRIVRMLPNLWNQKRAYCPYKTTEERR